MGVCIHPTPEILARPDTHGYTEAMRGMPALAPLVGLLMVVSAAQAAPKAAQAAPKKDRERMDVEDVVATSDGQFVVVLKTQGKPARLLPIWIGENEAVAIRMRLTRTDPPRPLTLNLLESVLSSGNIKLVEVNIDSLKGDVYLGTLRLKQNARVWEVDARPSDAIGLALGKSAAIWVSREVLDRASINESDLKTPKAPAKPEPPAKEKPKSSSYEETL
jgi:bifunctional DNase/RNase